jgi:hypothetical protein
VKFMRLVNNDARPAPARMRALLPMLGLCFGICGCGGPGRSTAAVCHVWDTQGLALHEKYEAAANAEKSGGAAGVISVLASAIGAPNELAHLMTQMAEVAPPESQSDFESLSSGLKKMSESEGKAVTDPLGAIAGNLVESAAIAGSYARVNAFILKNCGIP